MPAARRTSSILAAAVLLAGCSGDQDPGPSPDPSLPLASYATEGLSVARADFCDLIDSDAVERALDAAPTTTDHYGNGDVVEVASGVTDIAHEYNCTFTSGAGTEARAWVFAPPVTTDRADDIVRKSLKSQGCEPLLDAATFGTPTVATLCQSTDENSVTFSGLFVDAWLSCSVSVPPGDDESLEDRADRWCAAVAEAAHQRLVG